jgi:hypothetical protein
MKDKVRARPKCQASMGILKSFLHQLFAILLWKEAGRS